MKDMTNPTSFESITATSVGVRDEPRSLLSAAYDLGSLLRTCQTSLDSDDGYPGQKQDVAASLSIANAMVSQLIDQMEGHESGASPIHLAFQEWQAARQVVETGDHKTDEEFAPLHARMNAVAGDILEVNPEGPMDVVYKFIAVTAFGQHDLGDVRGGRRVYDDARALIDTQTRDHAKQV